MGDSNLVVNWMHGRWTIHNVISRMEVQKTQNMSYRNRHLSDDLPWGFVSADIQELE